VTLLTPGLGRVEADPLQLEEVISQLAINARDAMPDGGTLTIRTANVEVDAEFASEHLEAAPGGYVTLEVSDTGAGIRPAAQAHHPAGAETVLVAEDEEMVRELICEVLEGEGFRVLVARHAPEALAVGQRCQSPIDLLVTDVAMPGMNGPELVERLAASHPNM